MNEILASAVNFSEGRNLDAIHQIAAAAAKRCHLLDVYADPDHNKSVVTLAGAPPPLVGGILAASAKAVDL
ncbi:MAG: glutamate formimidoyltransferase, partial [Actinomycetota bacterium]